MLLALAEMIPALIQFSRGNQWMPLAWAQRRDTMWRASGFFIYPNNLAGFLELIGLMAASFSIWGKGKSLHKILTTYIALVCAGGVAISGSRGGYLSLFFGGSVILLLSLIAWSRLKNKNYTLVLSICAGALFCLTIGVSYIIYQSHEIAERVMQIHDPENVRFLLWEAAIKQFLHSPIWGTGGDSYLYFGRLYRNPLVQQDPIHAHNDYLQLLADYGVVGMVLFLLFLLMHLRSGIRAFAHLIASESLLVKYQSDRLALCIGAFAGLAAYVVHSIVDFNMQMPMNAFTMATIFSVLANPGSPHEEQAPSIPSVRIRHFFRWCLPVLGVALLAYSLPMMPGEYYAERSRVALRDKDPAKSLELARKGIAWTKKNPELYFDQGEAAMQLSTIENKSAHQLQHEGLQAYANALLLFRYDSRIALRLALAHASVGDYTRAIESVNYAERLDPNSSFIPAYRGLVEFNFQHLDKAKELFQRAMRMGGEGGGVAMQGVKLLPNSMMQTPSSLDPGEKGHHQESLEKDTAGESGTDRPKDPSSLGTSSSGAEQSNGDLLQGMPSMTMGHDSKKSAH